MNNPKAQLIAIQPSNKQCPWQSEIYYLGSHVWRENRGEGIVLTDKYITELQALVKYQVEE